MATKETKAKYPDKRFVTVPMDSALYAGATAQAVVEERSLVSLMRLALKLYLGQGVTRGDDTIG